MTTDKNSRRTDNLARKVHADSPANNVAVLNPGIGANQALHGGLGPTGLSRIDRDVIAQRGIRRLVVLEGINDLGTGSPDPQGAVARELITAYEQIVARAHARGMEVYGATILPFGGSFYDTPGREAERQTINNLIGKSVAFDAVIVMIRRCSILGSHFVKSITDSGDHLHPQDEGYRILGDAIDLGLFVQ